MSRFRCHICGYAFETEAAREAHVPCPEPGTEWEPTPFDREEETLMEPILFWMFYCGICDKQLAFTPGFEPKIDDESGEHICPECKNTRRSDFIAITPSDFDFLDLSTLEEVSKWVERKIEKERREQ